MTTLAVGFSNSEGHSTRKLREKLLLVEGISPEEVLCSLKRASHGPETEEPFTVFDLNRRVQFAARALKDRYSDEKILFNATFLNDIDIPVSVVKYGEDWFVLDISRFDAIHGEGKAMSIISALGKVKTLPQITAGPILKSTPEERKEYRFSLSSLNRIEFLGILFALMQAKRSGASFSLRELKSKIPEEAVKRLPSICRIYGITEPLERDVLLEVCLQTGLEIKFEADEILIRGITHQVAGEINCLIEILHERAHAAWKWFFVLTGTIVHLFFKMLIVLCLATEDSIENLEAIILPWVATIWAPFSLGAMWAYGKTSVSQI